MMVEQKRSRNVITSLIYGNSLIGDQPAMASLVVNYFTNLFCFAGTPQDFSIIENNIHCLVDSSINDLLIMIPSSIEIFSVVMGAE